MTPDVELVYFEGCPHVEAARAALRAALLVMGFAPEWKEWDQDDPKTPARVQRYGSPTVLVGDREVRGASPQSTGRGCSIDGPPSVEEIRRALAAEIAD